MKIAQVAPLHESVPPKFYGGTERVVSYLTEALVETGHDVTLFASGDSVTRAELRPCCRGALRLDRQSVDPMADHVYLAECVFQEAGEFDIVHSHIDYIGFPLWRRMHTPRVTTLHGRLDIPNLQNLYREFSDEPLVSISDFQRRPLQPVNWLATVHHGVPRDLYSFHEQPGDYLAFLGRVSPEKRLEDAIEIAKRAGIPLKIAAKVDNADREYFASEIRPQLDHDGIEFIGEISDAEKGEFLGNALALLFMIDWPEPFGLVMIESLACGTPVIARARGSVPEILQHGASGFIVRRGIDEAVQAVNSISRLSRKRCREIFDERFTAERMARNYLAVYEDWIEAKPLLAKPSRRPALRAGKFFRAPSFSRELGV
ncbi:MAG TPA: glycosyltransferase family 4 protein [Verrucomicrobiae bacterium]|jgi:glycosyltransferase involved in cell wall biosynthesis|nr:glycosyltransferase family 4 protein [Verrucomicrobiae bacterium]